METDLTVAIQGIKGSFHHQVASEYFGSSRLCECSSFDNVVRSLNENRAQKAVMALENSIAGAIIPNYALIDQHNLRVIGEHYLNIHMNLMALPGQTIDDLVEVHSHPMALLQCAVFFADYPKIRLVECSDTAESARRITASGLMGIGAVAGPAAAELYGLEVLRSGIHTVKSNMTRFVILSPNNHIGLETEANKASLKFELDDEPGALAAVLNAMTACKLNLTKIQSMPVIETPFKYSFFVDVMFSKYKHYERARDILRLMTEQFKVLGEYQAGAR